MNKPITAEELLGHTSSDPAPTPQPANERAFLRGGSDVFEIALAEEGIDDPVLAGLARSIHQQESGGGRNTKTSNAGAVGGMQILPGTFKEVADGDWDIANPVHNARAGIRYVKAMADRANGDPFLAAVGYYGGPGAQQKARNGVAVSDPRNPKAPNTLQYAQQVVSRIPELATGKVTPATPKESGAITAEELLSMTGGLGLTERPAPIPERSAGEAIGDLAIGVAQGGLGAVQAVTDIFGADNPASRLLNDGSKALQNAKSDRAQQIARASQQRIEDTKGEGTMAEIGAYLDAVWDAPLDMTAQAAGSFLPFLFTGGVAAGARALSLANAAKTAGVTKKVFLDSPAGKAVAQEIAKNVGTKFTKPVNTAVGVAMGLGGVKGQQYETTLREAKAAGKSDEEAKQLATEAQAYGNSVGGTLQQIGGAALGGVAAATGPLERALSRIPGAAPSSRDILGRAGMGALKELFPEGGQAFQQAWAGNAAAIDAGVMDPSRRFEGAAGQAIQEAVLAAPMGGAAGAMEPGPVKQNKPAPAPARQPTAPVAPPVAPATPPVTPTATAAGPAASTPTASPLDLGDASIDPAMAKLSDEELQAMMADVEAREEDATDDDWVNYSAAMAELDRRKTQPATAEMTSAAQVSGVEKQPEPLENTAVDATNFDEQQPAAAQDVAPSTPTVTPALDNLFGEVQAEEVPTPEPAPSTEPEPAKPLDQMSEAELRERVAYIGEQAKMNGGWSKPLIAERNKVRKALEAITRKVAPERAVQEPEAADQPQQGNIQNTQEQTFAFKPAAEKKAREVGGTVDRVNGRYVVRMPQKMSGTPSATMGTRTDAKAGPGSTAADVVRRDPIAGQKINDEWTAFAPQSGTLGIPRAEMPQVKAGDRGAMVNFLKARGINSSKEQLPPTALKPTQAEFSPAKVQEAADRTDGDRSIIVSQDGYVVDGHHQWLAQRQKGEPINVIRLDQPITQVLDALKQMPSAQPESIEGANAVISRLRRDVKNNLAYPRAQSEREALDVSIVQAVNGGIPEERIFNAIQAPGRMQESLDKLIKSAQPEQSQQAPSRADLDARAPLLKADPDQLAKEQAELDAFNAFAGIVAPPMSDASDWYTLPEGGISESWRDAEGRSHEHPQFQPNERQQRLMDEVAKALDDGAFYNDDVQARVAASIGVSNAVLERNETGVQGGDFGYDVYKARKAVEAKRSHQELRRVADELALQPGDQLGTLIFNDFKINTNVAVETVSDDGLEVNLKGKRGKYTVNLKTAPIHVKFAMDRAKERGKRKDTYEEFVAGRIEGAESQPNQPPAQQTPALNPAIKLNKLQQREAEAGGAGLAGELDPQVQQSLLAMRNNPKVPDVPVKRYPNGNISWSQADVPDFVDLGNGYSLRGYTRDGAVVQEIKLPNGMRMQRQLNKDGTISAEMEGDFRQIVEGQGFAEAKKLVEDFYANNGMRKALVGKAPAINEKPAPAKQTPAVAATENIAPEQSGDALERKTDEVMEKVVAPGMLNLTRDQVRALIQEKGVEAADKTIADYQASKAKQAETTRKYSEAKDNADRAKKTQAEAANDKPELAPRSLNNRWISVIGEWDVLGEDEAKNHPGFASEKSARIAISKNPEWKRRGATILPFDYNDGSYGMAYSETRTRYVVVARKSEVAPEANQPSAQQTPAVAATENVAIKPGKPNPITRADVAAAERLAADMIRQKIGGMKAGEVQRIAARFLQTMGKQVPVGKAKIADAMTDVSAFSLLNPAAELGVELSESVKRALTADREGRVSDGEPTQAPSQTPTENDYPLGKTDKEDRFMGTRVRVRPELRGEAAWEGEIVSTLNGGRLFSIRRDGTDMGSIRIPGARLEILQVVDAEKPVEVEAGKPINTRWDALKAKVVGDGKDKDPGQQSYRAFASLIKAGGEPMMDAWERWSSELGSTDLINRTGEQVLQWMESGLPKYLDGYVNDLPMGPVSNFASLASMQKAAEELGRRTPSHDAFIDKMEKRIQDVEKLGGDQDAIRKALQAVVKAKKAFIDRRLEIEEGVKAAAAREAQEKAKQDVAEAGKYHSPDLKELSKKPTPASVTGWFEGVLKGEKVWTNGQIADLTAVPHLKDWENRKNALPRGPVDVARVIPRDAGQSLELIGTYDGKGDLSQMPLVFFEAGGQLAVANRNYVKYFSSKYQGADYQYHGDRQPLTVHLNGEIVGVIMPVTIRGLTLEGVKQRLNAQPAATQPKATPAAEPQRFEYPTPLPGQPEEITQGQRAVVDFMNGDIDKPTMLRRFAEIEGLRDYQIRQIMTRLDGISQYDLDQVQKAREELAKRDKPVAEPNPLEHTPKQYADAWLRWSAETNGLPLAEVREMQGDEAGLKAIEQRWVDAVVNQTKSGQPLPAKTLDKLLEIRPNTVLPESAIPAGYQRPEARKLERAQKSAPTESDLEAIFAGLEANSAEADGLKKRKAEAALKDAIAERPDAEVINQVESQFYDMLLSLMERGDLEVNGHKTIHEENESCL